MPYRFRALAILSLVSCTPAAATSASSRPSTASPDFRKLESEIFSELNSARTKPAAYASSLSRLLPLFDGTLLRRPGWPVPVRTNEGAAAVREAIAALDKQARVGPLVFSEPLSHAARDHANDQSRTGSVGHTGSDGSSPATRINRYGTWGTTYAENVDYARVISGRDVIEDLLIDDGVSDRGHRHNIYEANAHVVGIGCAPHPKYGAVCVIDQAGSFKPR